MDIEYTNVKVIPAILAWVCIVIGYYFIVEEPLDNKYIRGIILGVGMYGVYNMTNLAIYNKYSYDLAFQDTFWGISLISLVTLLTSILYVERRTLN